MSVVPAWKKKKHKEKTGKRCVWRKPEHKGFLMPYKEVYGRNNSESLKDCDQKNSTVKIKQNNNNIRCSKI